MKLRQARPKGQLQVLEEGGRRKNTMQYKNRLFIWSTPLAARFPVATAFRPTCVKVV